MSVIARRITAATSASASSSFPYAREKASIRRRDASAGEQLLQLRPVLRARLDDARPAHLVRAVEILLRRGRVELDRLDAGLRLALRLVLVVLLPGLVLRLERDRLLHEVVALLRRQRLPLVEVDDQRHLGVVETRVDAVFGVLLPVEVEQRVDRPAVAVDDAAL